MATSRGMGQFSKRMKVVSEIVGENASLAVRRAALAADSTVIVTTPVDEGTARVNWVTSIGAPVVRQIKAPVPGSGDASATAATLQGANVIKNWKLGAGPIFLTNSLPYIIPLDEGHSQQAPNGMTGMALQSARDVLTRARLLKGV